MELSSRHSRPSSKGMTRYDPRPDSADECIFSNSILHSALTRSSAPMHKICATRPFFLITASKRETAFDHQIRLCVFYRILVQTPDYSFIHSFVFARLRRTLSSPEEWYQIHLSEHLNCRFLTIMPSTSIAEYFVLYIVRSNSSTELPQFF